jgi:hypothetical protein
MGNVMNRKINPHELKSCLFCWEKISTREWTECVRCNIVLHTLCEEKYRGEKRYCECPHCRRIGTIGTVCSSIMGVFE